MSSGSSFPWGKAGRSPPSGGKVTKEGSYTFTLQYAFTAYTAGALRHILPSTIPFCSLPVADTAWHWNIRQTLQHVVHYINHAGRRLSCSEYVIGARMETTHRKQKKKNAPPRPHRIRGLQLLDWEARSRYCRWFQRTGVQQISRTTTRVFHERGPVYIKWERKISE